ncbi:LysR family transcriptional regulator [Nocardia sp. CDC159]|uniref:LysR family transcriptional regulator n=1 Tax=Nocardia pulmonis TaxID=2951408 RepID=A0A9X2ECN9_9NOCA|nr:MULTISPECIES: LysR family transcriptional regulator [Nocardia]MCM6778467.1 LysR family transcriptional regulator [Nocardia pulmonis]MCM6791356.1 LysR family transcriptional regulator [Nocardia sp. CDC159]
MLDFASLTSNPITLRQIEYFVWSVRLGSKALAAKKFGVTPSAMSQQICALEAVLDRKLYDRASGRSSLTRFGNVFFEHAAGVMDSFYETLSVCRTFSDDVVTVGATTTLATKLIPPIIYRMQRERQVMRISVESYTDTRSLCAALDRGIVDLAVGPLETFRDGRNARTIGEEELVIACHRSRAAGLEATWPALALQPWVGYRTHSDIDKIIRRESERAGVDVRYVATAGDVPTALSLVAHGIGVTLVPKMALKGAWPMLSAVHLEKPIRRTISVQARDESPVVDRFLEIAGNGNLGRKLVAIGLLEGSEAYP